MPKPKSTITFRYSITGSAELDRNMIANSSYELLQKYLREVQNGLRTKFASRDAYIDLQVGRHAPKKKSRPQPR